MAAEPGPSSSLFSFASISAYVANSALEPAASNNALARTPREVGSALIRKMRPKRRYLLVKRSATLLAQLAFGGGRLSVAGSAGGEDRVSPFGLSVAVSVPSARAAATLLSPSCWAVDCSGVAALS